MNNTVKKQLNYKKPLPDHLLKKIKRKGFITGSYVYGGWNKKTSDIDICIKKEDIDTQEIIKYVFYFNGDYRLDDDTYFSLYIKSRSDVIFNILIMNNNAIYMNWKKSHNIMLKMINIPILRKAFKEKNNRVGMFELLKKIVKR